MFQARNFKESRLDLLLFISSSLSDPAQLKVAFETGVISGLTQGLEETLSRLGIRISESIKTSHGDTSGVINDRGVLSTKRRSMSFEEHSTADFEAEFSENS